MKMKSITKSLRYLIILSVLSVAATSAIAQRGKSSSSPSKSDLYQSEIGEVYVSIIGTRPLDAVIEELQPQFNVTTDEALQKAVPDTLRSSESTLSSFNAALRLGMMFGVSGSTNSPNAAIA